ncbi:MAG: hypothetical protein OXB92_05250 [Acidimicrobiaceae bacterium]|nr:hypothetical protein [Acidimicrobiia bacterium]MCY4493246.1 hypothetical protein [Acidimicrobiaceae bacterium]
MDFVGRHIRTQIEEALESSRVVMLHGARQCGRIGDRLHLRPVSYLWSD